jgi:hypothetical protein
MASTQVSSKLDLTICCDVKTTPHTFFDLEWHADVDLQTAYGRGCDVPLAGYKQPAEAEHPAEPPRWPASHGCTFKPATP